MSDIVPVKTTILPDEMTAIRPGSWWRKRDDRWNVPSGTIWLCSKIAMADGYVHSVTLAKPPSQVEDRNLKHGVGGYTLLATELLEGFSPVDAAEAIASRDKEIADLQKEVADLHEDTANMQRDLLAIGTTPMPTMQALTSLTSEEAETPTADRTALIAAKAADMQAEIASRAEAIKAVTDRLQMATTAMQTKSARMTLYMSERAEAALASVQPALAVAARLQEHVDTMGLYIGTDVNAHLLVEGPSAPADEKLTILQRRLYMDEELLIHLESGGADYKDVNSLVQALQEDKTLVERIFGAPRAVVAVAWRRKDKDYLGDSDKIRGFAKVLQAAMEAHQKNEINKETFLLIRDGGKIWAVYLPVHLNQIERLFPTPQDLQAPYRERAWFREEPKEIGPDNLNYAKATEEFRKLALQYERVLLLLSGLHDRLEIFGPFLNGGYTGFMDPRVQQERFHLIWDDQNLLGSNRLPYAKWFESKNKLLRSGARVAVRWHRAMTPESAPGAVEYVGSGFDSKPRFRYQPTEKFGIAIVRREGTDMIVDCEVSRDVWKPEINQYVERCFNARVNLTESAKHADFSYLVLDDVDPEEIDHYVNSRTERQHYLEYVHLLIMARDALLSDLKEEEQARLVLLDAAAQGKLQTPENGWNPLLREVIRDWRADNRGAALPKVTDDEWPKVRDKLLSKIWFAAGSGSDKTLASQIALDIQAHGKTAFRLTRSGSNKLFLYTESNLNDGDLNMKDVLGRWPFVTRAEIVVGRDGGYRIAKTSEITPSQSNLAGETSIEEWNHFPGFRQLGNFANGGKLRDCIKQAINTMITPSWLSMMEPDKQELLEAIKVQHAITVERSKGRVYTPKFFHPVGFGTSKSKERDNDNLRLVGYAENARDWIARHADDETRALLIQHMNSIYRNPEAAISRLPDLGDDPKMHYVRMEFDARTLANISYAEGKTCVVPDGSFVRETSEIFNFQKNPHPSNAAELMIAAGNHIVSTNPSSHNWNCEEALELIREIKISSDNVASSQFQEGI